MNKLTHSGLCGRSLLAIPLIAGLAFFQITPVIASTDGVQETTITADALEEPGSGALEAETAKPESPATEAKSDFKNGAKGVGSGFKNGTKATGRAFKKAGTGMGKGFKKAGTTMGRGFKYVGRSIKNIFTRNKSNDGVEEQDLAMTSGEAEGEAAYQADEDLDAVGNDDAPEAGQLAPLEKGDEWVQGDEQYEASS